MCEGVNQYLYEKLHTQQIGCTKEEMKINIKKQKIHNDT